MHSLQADIIAAAADTEVDEHNKRYDDLCDLADTLCNSLHGIKMGFAPADPTPSASFPSTMTKLPKLDLKPFDGNLLEWISFHDMFDSAVHQNCNVPKVQKLVYLKSLLRGEAARQIQSLVLSDSNYDTAWKLLHDRYQNEREILFTVLKRLFSQHMTPSASGVRQLIDVTKECIRSLEILQLTPDKSTEAIILYSIVTKLDNQSRELWEQSMKGTSIPPLADLFEFLEQRARAIAASGSSSMKSKFSKGDEQHHKKVHVHHSQSNHQCKCCSQANHLLFRCPKFLSMSVSQRYEVLKTNNSCFNCLAENHMTKDCSNPGRCKKCKKQHNTLLHPENQSYSVQAEVINVAHGSTTGKIQNPSCGLLTTAIVEVQGSCGSYQVCRAFLDAGSTSSFVAQSCATRLGLKRQKTSAQVVGLGSTSVGTVNEITTIKLRPHFTSSDLFTVNALVLPKVTADLPASKFKPDTHTHLQHLKLADPQWFKPGPVDILLGADIFWSLIKANRISGASGSSIAVDSKLGWLVAGKIETNSSGNLHVHFAMETNLDETLRLFWELETIPEKKHLSPSEVKCEEHFSRNTSRSANKKFVVKLPFKESKLSIGSSAQMAVRRLNSLEKRLATNQNYYKEYIAFMREYETLGHMTRVKSTYRDASQCVPVFIPHHFVLKAESTTTKFRVVFDASAKTSSGSALNDNLHVSPTLQDNIVDIILRFRIHPIAFTADIAKMYRQIDVCNEDRIYQHILWRESPEDEIKQYQLNTVTYGTASAPYLAVKCLRVLAAESHLSYPLASSITHDSFFVDDVMHSLPEINIAIQAHDELCKMTSGGGFKLRKWVTNDRELLNHIPETLREKEVNIEVSSHSSVKALGIWWNTKDDFFYFQSKPNDERRTVQSKRDILSEVSKLYDPIGWVSPVIIKSKILMQELWKSNVTWDEPVQHSFIQQWEDINSDLSNLPKLKISRCMIPQATKQIDLHGFCDASERAYAAVIYLVASYQDSKKISLVTSKTRVAPVKCQSLPRLELCGAVLLVDLLQSVNKALKLSINSYHCWTDSTIVLAWIQSPPSRWKTFVANRVSEIQQADIPINWHHVAGTENPADCASRGISVSELSEFSLWWNGPHWLQSSQIDDVPKPSIQSSQEVLIEEKACSKIQCHAVNTDSNQIISNYSNLTHLVRITAWCTRFCHNCKSLVSNRKSGLLTTKELQRALDIWIRDTQRKSFPHEMRELEAKKALPSSSKLLSLSPFLDENNIIRVGGRLKNSTISYNKKHPVVLPRKSLLTDLIINSYHLKYFHAGPNLLLAAIQSQFWILGAREAIRFHTRRCVICTKFNAKLQTQIMGDLPTSRVTPSPAFSKCGVDYAGPMLLKSGSIRKPMIQKAYIALFVCFSTRAIHLELVSSLSSEAFIAALKRFLARRGLPSHIHSDCGTNFVGASKQLKEFHQLVSSKQFNEDVSCALSKENIQWGFNPPGAPHFGGLWEAGVKSVKTHLYKIIGSQKLTYKEMVTVLTQVEACLNSRPLTEIQSNPNELEALTPAHFLIGRSLLAVPEPSVVDINQNRLSRWQFIQQLYQHFWKRWSSEYLSTLQQRPNWLKQRTSIEVNDLVIIKENQMPSQKWRMGRVIKVYPGDDKVVRVVALKTSDGEIKRPISKLCILPIPASNSGCEDIV